MKFLQKAASVSLAASMIFGSGAVNVFAQEFDTQKIFNNRFGGNGLGFAPNLTVEQADPGASKDGDVIRQANAGTARKIVGETGFLQGMPINDLNCKSCNYSLFTSNPVVYAEASAEFSNPGIIETVDFTNVASNLHEDFPDAHAIQYNYKAVKAGKTHVKVTYYANFYMQLGNSYVSYLTCEDCGTRNSKYDSNGSDFDYHKVIQEFDVVVSEDPNTTFTVTYTDGVENEIVFPDEAYTGLKKGDNTPQFTGSTERPGYTFMGWAPAVASKVTESVTYTATWTKNPEQEEFTITYTDGLGGTVFGDETHGGLHTGDKTPSFNGSTEREGYVFKGWNPEFKDTVSGNETYVAVWEEKKDPQPEEPGKKDSMPGIDKKLFVNGNEVTNGVVDRNSEVAFKLTSNLPDALLDKYVTGWNSPDGKEENAVAEGNYVLTFHDVMDAAYKDRSEFTVKVGDTDLTEGDYKVEEATDGCSFHISLDLIALYNAKKITKDDIKAARPVTVEYTATYNPVPTTGAFKNKAWVAGTDVPENSDEVEADLFGIKAKKIDSKTNAALSGAEFTLWKDEAKTEKVADGVCGEDGVVSFDNLTAGTYYLEETKAPAGYIRNTSLIEVVVDKEADEADGTVDFFVSRDVANAAAPHTGGAGTTLFTAGGAALLGAAVLVAVSKKRKQAK